ncbi:hypothetical protein GVO57_01140 [Sphingomonas changnyeongensis]|uniref:Right handed beta helix domain-containing protein n=1 Tax=Sphingomonas changnyeongensis TaxID=2698679 RepID=A0A7Z2S7J4_9SPHN|nr:right-handed parallel beta-helix repeat-containing protein [Sphingomonas changnyeongensis]QHL89682.1 hypothetical protein GVO57_01140 [Sphingomonas changnyeongensis]
MTVITVTDRAQLDAALARASGGETILLAPGSYGTLALNSRSFAADVTIASADAGNPARLDGVHVNGSRNILFRGLDIGRALAPGEPEWTQLATVTNAENIRFDSVSLHGSLDGNAGNDGWGLYVTGTRGFALTGSNVQELMRAFVIEQSSDIRIADNLIHRIRSDGGDFAAVDGVVIENNLYRDFQPSAGDHADAIQFWTAGQTRGSSNVLIRNNVVLQGNGTGTQGIFIRDEQGRLPHSNVRIENNLIYSSDQFEGISVEGAIGVAIIGNTVVSPTSDAKRLWIRVDRVDGALIARNVTDDLLIGTATGLAQSDNAVLHGLDGQDVFLPRINAGAGAAIADLIVPGMGFQPGALPVWPGAQPQPAPSPAPTPSQPVPSQPAPSDPDTPQTGGRPALPPAELPTPWPEADMPFIRGGTGNDWLTGGDAAEWLTGVADADGRLGRGSIDRLTGGGGPDVFALGDARGRFYDDGQSRRGGRGDYGQILDFSAGDRIMLAGAPGDYVFRKGRVGGLAGIEILHDSNGNGRADSRDELIGHVAGVPDLPLDAFIFG